MDAMLQRLREDGVRLDALGVTWCDGPAHWCTPAGAEIFGYAGVDGIHYCTVPGQGETIYAVSPMNGPGEAVHPIARNGADLLRLLLACGDAAALEQAWQWDRAQFDDFVAGIPLDGDTGKALDALRRLGVTPMEDPWAYLQSLAPYPEEPEPEEAPAALPPWQVRFEGNLWGGRGRPGREIPVGRTFCWDGGTYLVPALYRCGKGLVVDLLRRAEAADVAAYLERWQPRAETAAEEEQARMEAENPLWLDVNAAATVNGRTLRCRHSSGTAWIPGRDDENGPVERAFVEHYRLDPACGWAIRRLCFPWETARGPRALRTVTLTLEAERLQLPGPRFSGARPGMAVPMTHPATGAAYTLTVRDCRPETVSMASPGWPGHCMTLAYSLWPALPPEEFAVRDTVPSDPVRRTDDVPDGAASIGIIGGADGPVAVLLAGPAGADGVRTACSSLHDAPPADVTWQTWFRVKPREDCTVPLLPAE